MNLVCCVRHVDHVRFAKQATPFPGQRTTFESVKTAAHYLKQNSQMNPSVHYYEFLEVYIVSTTETFSFKAISVSRFASGRS